MARELDPKTGRSQRTLAGALAFLAAAAVVVAAERPDFSGNWRLNPTRSDNAKEKIEQAAGPASVKGGGLDGGRERWLPRGEGNEVERLRLRERMLEIADQLERLEIAQGATEIKVAHGDLSRIFYFGREHVRETEGGEKLKARTSWKGEQLVIDEQGDKGLRIIEVYTLLPQSAQVVQALRFESSLFKQPVEIRLLYDRVKD
jgi:hypothetical protein